MKKVNGRRSVARLLLVTALLASGFHEAMAEGRWLRTDFSNLTDGDTVVIVDTYSRSLRAMCNDGSTAKAPESLGVTLSDDGSELVAEPQARTLWVVRQNDEGLMFVLPGTEFYLYCNSADNGVRVSNGNTTNSNKYFTTRKYNNVPFLYNVTQKRYIGYYSSDKSWRSYKTPTNTTIGETVIAFFRKESATVSKTMEVTLKAGYNSFCSEQSLSFLGSGVRAFTACQQDGVVRLKEIEDGIVPRGEGVILQADAAGDYKAYIRTSTDASVGDNELHGVTSDTRVDYSNEEKTMFNYILQRGMFFKATGAVLREGRAYLSTPYDISKQGAEARLTIADGNRTTGGNGTSCIGLTMEENTGSEDFGLSGTKVHHSRQGIHITKGKKFLKK